MLELSEVFAARAVLQAVARTTPIFAWPERGTYLKAENFQRTGSFKIRGAYNLLQDPTFKSGVVTASSGNHGTALACAAAQLGIPAHVVMPLDAPAIKVNSCRHYGAQVELCGYTSSERQQRAQELANELSWAYAESYDHPRIIAGQGTVGLELLQQLRELKQVVCPIGGGGLISGIALVCKRLAPHVRVVGVEPEGANGMCRSLASGQREAVPKVDTIADGLRVRLPGVLTFKMVQQFVDEVVTVTDEEILEAMRDLFHEGKMVVEPSGAAAHAAVLAGRVTPNGQTAVIISGGNIDAPSLARLLSN